MKNDLYHASDIMNICQSLRDAGGARDADYLIAISAVETAFRPGGVVVYFSRHIARVIDGLVVAGYGRSHDYTVAIDALRLAFGIQSRAMTHAPPVVVETRPRLALPG